MAERRVAGDEECINFGLASFSKLAEKVQALAIFVWKRFQ